MNTSPLECPNCGAGLTRRKKNGFIRCEYCDSIIYIGEVTDEFDPGELRKLLEPQKELEELQRQLGEAKARQLQGEIKCEEAEKSVKAHIIYSLAIIFFLYECFASGIGYFILGLAVSVFSFFPFRHILQSRREDLRRHVLSISSEIDTLQKRADTIRSEYDFTIIPESYRNYDAMHQLYEILIRQRASTLSAAINIYEDDKYKENMTEMRRKQLQMQQDQLDLQRQQSVKSNAEDTSGDGFDFREIAAAGTFLAVTWNILKRFRD